MRTFHSLTASVLLASSMAFAAPAQAQVPDQGPPPAPYVKVSSVLPLPEFIPGLGTLYVEPGKLPAGPFLAYDRQGKLSATVYMTPIADLQASKAFNNLAVGNRNVVSVDVYFNAGHPGVEKPHAHVVLYHDASAKARLEK